MEALDYSMIQVKSTIEIERLLDLEVKREFNRHGVLKLRGIIHEDRNYQGAMTSTAEDTIEIRTNENAEDKVVLFKGVVCFVHVTCIEGTYYIEIIAYSGSIVMDMECKSRSFQNKEMEYSELVKCIAYDYSGGDAETPNGMKKKIAAPIIQYNETDWEFLKRIASHMNTVLIPDVQDSKPRVFVGVPESRNKGKLPPDIPYTVSRDYSGFYNVQEQKNKVQENDFLYYEIDSYQNYEIGDKLSFKNKNLIIASKHMKLVKGLLVFRYTLAFPEKMVHNKMYNPNITGVGFIGTIIQVKDEYVKIHLDIDEKQDRKEAFWFNVNTLTGNALYAMPEVGTRWNLVVPCQDEAYAEVTTNLRINGEQCPYTSEPKYQYFLTQEGKGMAMTPSNISFNSMNSGGNLMLELDDEEGIRITSHKKITLSAEEKLEIKSKGAVMMKADEILTLQRGKSGKGISLENEINLLNTSSVKLNGKSKIPLPAMDIPATAPDMKSKKKDVAWSRVCSATVGAVPAEGGVR